MTKEEEQEQKLRNFEFVSDTLNAKPVENHRLKEYKALLDNDFEKELCNAVPGVNHAETTKEIHRVLDEMKRIAQCKELHSKRIGAIGGGFSSGKSSFINSFLDGKKIKLVEGVNPVTVIPSYVICDERSQVAGVSSKGGLFPIDLDMYKSLSHDYIERTFTFDLNELIYYTIVLTPMKNELFGNLCLIDTPGYNPPTSGKTKNDFLNARRYIEKAEFLIWLVGLDSTGTFPMSDIKFRAYKVMYRS